MSRSTGWTEVVCNLRNQIFSDRISLPLWRWHVVCHPCRRIQSHWVPGNASKASSLSSSTNTFVEHIIKRSRGKSSFVDVLYRLHSDWYAVEWLDVDLKVRSASVRKRPVEKFFNKSPNTRSTCCLIWMVRWIKLKWWHSMEEHRKWSSKDILS